MGRKIRVLIGKPTNIALIAALAFLGCSPSVQTIDVALNPTVHCTVAGARPGPLLIVPVYEFGTCEDSTTGARVYLNPVGGSVPIAALASAAAGTGHIMGAKPEPHRMGGILTGDVVSRETLDEVVQRAIDRIFENLDGYTVNVSPITIQLKKP